MINYGVCDLLAELRRTQSFVSYTNRNLYFTSLQTEFYIKKKHFGFKGGLRSNEK